jgi:protein O-mannosyl-transferase
VSTKRNQLEAAPSRRSGFLGNRGVMEAAVLLVSILVYLRCLGNGFVFDDDTMIVRNRFIGSPFFFWRSMISDSWWFLDPDHLPASSYYRPVQDIWLGLHFRLFGLDPSGWHATMVALNLVAVWLVLKIAGRLTGDWRSGVLAAALFALLPVHAEAVVWATAIPHTLGAALELGVFYLFITRGGAERLKWPLALALYGLALFGHESAVVFPAMIATYVFLLEPPAEQRKPPEGEPILRRAVRAIIASAPFAIETVIYLAIRLRVLGFINQQMPVNHMSGAEALMTLPAVLAADLAVLVIPWMASSAHNLPVVSSPASAEFYLSVIALVGLGTALVAALRRNPRRRLYLFCIAWMGLAIAPTLNLRGIFQGALLQDRYLYLPSAGWCVMVADWAFLFASANARRARIVWTATAALLALDAGLLWSVQHSWHDDVSFYTRLTKVAPNQSSWHYAFAIALEQRGDLPGAERELKESLRLSPGSFALYDLGVVHQRLGKLNEAAMEQAEGLKLLKEPKADAYVSLAQIYDLIGDHAKSEEALKYAESLPGGAHVAALARAQMKIHHKDVAGAMEILGDLASSDPYDPRVWTMLGIGATLQHDNEDALSDFQRALTIAPRDTFTRTLAAAALHRLGRDSEALDQCRAVLAVAPSDANARALMAKIQSKTASQPSSP